MTTSDVIKRDVASGDVSEADDVLSGGDVFSGAKNCGAPGQACCANEACYGAGSCCVDEICRSDGQDCGHGLGTCSSGSCGACGGVGQPCCTVDVSDDCSGLPDAGSCAGCTQTGTRCTQTSPDDGGTCVACGAVGQPCCYSQCTDEFAVCDDKNVCTSDCGGPGQPCCGEDNCRNGGCCMVAGFGGGLGGLCVDSPTCGCTAGMCTTCGVLGHDCCAGGLCEVNQGNCLGVDGSMSCEQMHP